jgi:hypothetical protein
MSRLRQAFSAAHRQCRRELPPPVRMALVGALALVVKQLIRQDKCLFLDTPFPVL